MVEELANMVAVSGEELEDIARARNEETPELRFLQEREGELYRQYRARVDQIQRSFEDSKQEPKRKRKSRWGDREPEPEPVVERAAPSCSRQSNPSVVAYALRVFGSAELGEEQWKQCEDQVKMAALYAELAAKQVRARLGGGGAKVQYDYDSDEDTEGGTWEHKARLQEMATTTVRPDSLMEPGEGRHHIGDFLPAEELNKFLTRYKVLRTSAGPAVAEAAAQEDKLSTDNKGFRLLQKMGWTEGEGLGSSGQGIVNPIRKSEAGADRLGLGANTGEAEEDDDEFDQYRKRMMLAYRFRPNPMKNPRRQYY